MTIDTHGCKPEVTPSPIQDPNLADLDQIETHLAVMQVESGIPYFDARRELWLNGKKKKPRSDQIPASITKFEEMVRDPGALRSNTVWDTGLGKVSKRLMEGGRLKYNLPMHLLIKVLYAGWIRDGVWPSDSHAPESEDVFVEAR